MRRTLLAAVALWSAGAGAADVRLLGLTDDNGLVRFAAARPADATRVAVIGVSGTLLGVDVRPADGRLYGVSTANDLYTIDAASGAARLVSTLTAAFDGSPRSGFDFNPQADRLRLVAVSGQNLRVHVDLGAVAVDGPLAYVGRDPHAGTRPRITAVAYTASRPNAPETRMFDIDGDLDVLAMQEPPNDGRLATVGPLGVDFGPRGGFDIRTDAAGTDTAYAASGATLYTVDLKTGAATAAGTIGDGRVDLIGLAVEADATR